MFSIKQYLTDNPGSSGAQISQGARIGTAKLYPALARMEEEGAITSQWEAPEPLPGNVPRRRLYWVAPPPPTPRSLTEGEML